MRERYRAGWKETLRIVGIYLFFGALWIVLSDVVVWGIFPHTEWKGLSMIKGLTFVALTGLLLVFLLSRSYASIDRWQRELFDSQRRFELFMANLPVAAFLKRPNGRYAYLNPFFRQRFLPTAPAQEESVTAFFPPALVARFAEDDRRVLETGQVLESELRTDDPKPEEFWLIRRFPVPTGGDGETLVGGFAVDITERRRLEQQLRQAGKMEALGRVAGGIAHDFNNMLTVINGYASLLSRELNGSPAARKALEIQAVSEKAAHLTSQLLAFSRKQQHHPERLDLNRVVRDAETLIRPLLPANVQLVLALDPGLPAVRADHTQFERVLLNLATNACDAMPGGGILSIEARKAPGSQGDRVQLTVRDNGIGMDENIRERIFEPFFTTKDPGKGTGLGLATVYGAVRQNGGAIAVESEPGRGSAFTITLPAA
jgi:two-component system, cell cycle sensor histidine kinase and response regulator CckA